MSATFHNASDLLNTDGTFNVALIMRLAHEKARAEINLAICTYANPAGRAFWRSRTFTRWIAEDAAQAATVDPAKVAAFKAQRSFPRHAALVKTALKDIWFAAKVTRQRWLDDAARRSVALPAPMFLQAAA